MLLEAGADVEGGALVDGQETSSETPLQLAAAAGMVSMKTRLTLRQYMMPVHCVHSITKSLVAELIH